MKIKHKIYQKEFELNLKEQLPNDLDYWLRAGYAIDDLILMQLIIPKIFFEGETKSK